MMGEYTPFMEYCTRPPSASSSIITLKRTHDLTGVPSSSRQRGGGILRNRPVSTTSMPTASALFEQEIRDRKLTSGGVDKTAELLAHLMASQGIPFECVNEPEFREFLQYVKPNAFPTPKVLEGIANRIGAPGKQKTLFAKATGSLSVTLDLVSDANDKYLVFSIHYFEENVFTRLHSVFLRRLILNDMDGASILTCLRRAVNNYSYSNVKFTNVLCPNEELASVFRGKNIVKRDFLCFYDYITRFVTRVMEIKQFQEGFEALLKFVNIVKNNSDYYCKYRRLQLTKNEELDLPSMDDDSWFSKFSFLSRCLFLHPSFDVLSARCYLPEYICPDTFNTLVYFQKTIQECVRCCLRLSGPLNSISQVIPAMQSLRTFISTHSRGYHFEADIKNAFTFVFQSITDGLNSTRYDIAALLDPRYAYSDYIYCNSSWKDVERKVILEFTNTTMFTCERAFNSYFLTIDLEEKTSLLSQELTAYRRACMTQRPEQSVDPFNWWALRQTTFEYLSVLAQEYLACPAITIDASHFFGENGKLNRLCKTYNNEPLENTLNFAGFRQQFKGKGDFHDRNLPGRIGDLDKLLSDSPLKYLTAPNYSPPHLFNAAWKPYNTRHVKVVQLPKETIVNSIVTKRLELEKEIKEELIDEADESEQAEKKEPPQKIVRVANPRQKPKVIGVFRVSNKYLNCAPLQQNLAFTPLPKKFVLVNPATRVTEPKNEPDNNHMMKSVEEIKEEFEDSKAYAKYKAYEKSKAYIQLLQNEASKRDGPNNSRNSSPRRPMNRRCVLCGNLEPAEKLKNVTIDMERLICLFGAIQRNEMTIEDAQMCFFRSAKSYFCRVHFAQASDDICTVLGVENAFFVVNSSDENIQQIGYILSRLRGRPMTLADTREHLISFTTRYSLSASELKPRPTLHLFDDHLFEDDDKSNDESVIVPKNEREPRKQVLEDVHQRDATILQIEEEPFKLPDTPLDDEVFGDDTDICCFCLSRRHKNGMLRVPASEDRVARWVDKLGLEFAERLQPGKNFVCRSHFGQTSFSSRGRLLKGMLPEIDNESVKVVYKMDGGNILKLHESKVGTDREPTVDLTEGSSNDS